MIYFDARLSRNHPTVEVRVADVCLRAEDAALLAVLVRAMVESAGREALEGVEPAPVPSVLLRMASWQASNFGLCGELLDFGSFRPAPAADVVNSLVDYLEPVLAEQGELELVRSGIAAIFERGTGAQEQRSVRQTVLEKGAPNDGGLGAVVAHAVRATLRGTVGYVDPDRDAEHVPELLRVRQS
jgi:carboxylate-amine ligase